MTNMKDCLTPKETAIELGVATHTLACWRMEARGPKFIKHGVNGRIYYTKDAIERYKKEFIREYDSTACAKVQGPKHTKPLRKR